MSRYLVTGAAGFIGSNLVLELESQGNEVVAVDSLRTGSKSNLRGFRGRFIESDIAGAFALGGPWDAIFHHGDITDPRHPNDDEVLQNNLGAFRNMVELAKESQCKLIYASTAGLYGNGAVPMNEDQPKQLLTAYAKSKMQMDELALSMEMPVVGLRYFNVFGPREAAKGRAASMVYHLFRQIQAGNRPKIFEFGDQRRDFIYVKDVVAANLAALKAPSGVYNVGTGTGTTFNELVDALGKALGKDTAPEYIPMPYDSASYQANTVADTRLASERLKFCARWAFQDAVNDYVDWMRSQ